MRGVWLVPALVGASLLYAGLDQESGLRTWLRLRGELRDARLELAALRSDIERLRGEAAALEADPFAQERAIREDLRLAQPGETVVRLSPSTGPNARFP